MVTLFVCPYSVKGTWENLPAYMDWSCGSVFQERTIEDSFEMLDMLKMYIN